MTLPSSTLFVRKKIKKPLGFGRRIAVLPVIALAVAAGFVETAAFSGSGDEWRRAEGGWAWSFPRDHGAHPEFKAEWWYFTGNLSDAGGARYGYQLTFFRRGVRFEASHPANPWSVRDVFMGHFTLTDAGRRTFRAEDLLSRAGPGLARTGTGKPGPGLAGAKTDGLEVWLLNWSARMKNGKVQLEARRGGIEIRLTLMPRKSAVLHGEKGLSRKGPGEGQASFHSSITDLETRGEIVLEQGGRRIPVSGKSWFDHEFGSEMLGKDLIGWDWFSLHLSDGADLMIYLLRRADGSIEPASAGTFIPASGAARRLTLGDISVEALDRWRSGKSGGVYPSRWRIRIAKEGIDLLIAPLLDDQELVSAGLPDLVYWEGAVEGKGRSGGREVSGEGYVELTGYAGNLRRVF